jgi:hypothetical protein
MFCFCMMRLHCCSVSCISGISLGSVVSGVKLFCSRNICRSTKHKKCTQFVRIINCVVIRQLLHVFAVTGTSSGNAQLHKTVA